MEHASHIPVEGTSNLRDLSWPLAAGARRAITRRVFRSANLDRLSPAGAAQFGALGVGVVIDLRGRAEAAAAPAFAGATRVHLPIEPNVQAELRVHIAAGTLSVAAAVAVMERTYRMYVLEYAQVFAEILHRTLDAKRQPVLFHCAAGKDRTGVAAALILLSAGVAPATVMEDYLLSNHFYRPTAASTLEIPDDVRAALIKVQPSFLEASLAAIDEAFGSTEAYLDRALGIGPSERAAMRAAIG
jgi:protein-tyrosine phosphatase